MITATVEELGKHLSDLRSWLSKEKEILVVQQGQVIACVTFVHQPQSPKSKSTQSKKSWEEQVNEMKTELDETWGSHVYTAEESADMIRESRGDR